MPEYTINIDVSISANNDVEASKKLAEILNGKIKYWEGEIKKEVQNEH